MVRTVRGIGFLLALLASVGAAASDWPQFRGPSRHGISAEPGLFEAWRDGSPRIVWRRPIGSGFSSVAVAGERLYTLASADGKEALLSLDAATGDPVWRLELGEPMPSEFGDGPRSTATIVDGRVYAVSSKARLVVADAAGGELVWDRDLTEFGPVPRFGYAPSPLVDGDLVLVEAGGPETEGIAAFDRDSGELRWRALGGPAGYSSPIVAEIGGVKQYLFFRRVGPEVVSLSTDGEILWRHATDAALTTIVAPAFFPPDRVFVASADDGFGALMLRVTASDEGFATEEIWSERLMRNHFNNSVLTGGLLCGFDNATLRCLDAQTGGVQWAKRGFGKGSVVAAGELLFVLGDSGTLAVVEASAEAYSEKARIQVTETRGKSWTPPSLANGRLYVRDHDEIVCLAADTLEAVDAVEELGDVGAETPRTSETDRITVEVEDGEDRR